MLKIKPIVSLIMCSNNNCLLRRHQVEKYFRTSAALYSAAKPLKEKASEKKLIYAHDLRELLISHLITKLKFYSGAFTVVCVPISLVFQYFDQIPKHSWLVVAFTGLAFTGGLFGAGLGSRNMIGRIYVSEDKRLVTFSIINFWGKKTDLEVPAEKIELLEPRFSFESKFYTRLKLGDYAEPVRLMKGKAKVDEKLFDEIFGDLL